jgi:hypothetical protein
MIQKSLPAKRSNLIRLADHPELIEGSLFLARDDALHRIASLSGHGVSPRNDSLSEHIFESHYS